MLLCRSYRERCIQRRPTSAVGVSTAANSAIVVMVLSLSVPLSQKRAQDHTETVTPAYNGYGNEDDLYAMGLSLEPLTKEVNQEEYDR